MESILQIISRVFSIIGATYLLALCAVGLFLSAFGFSGTWLVVIAAIAAFVARGSAFPGLGTVMAFLYLAILVEVAEYVLRFWGVRRPRIEIRVSIVALAGALLGAAVASVLPFSLFAAILGAPVGSFYAVYFYERICDQSALGSSGSAGRAVLARFLVLFLKISVTLGMTLWLCAGIARA